MSSEKIETAFLSLLSRYRYEDITISLICKQAEINRSTFYCHYDDINDLIIKIEGKFAKGMASIFNYGERQTHQAFIDMFEFVRDNKYFYRAFLNIPYSTLAERNIKQDVMLNLKNKTTIKFDDLSLYYRASFFGAGIKEICRLWLERDCKETPEQMASILKEEYKYREAY